MDDRPQSAEGAGRGRTRAGMSPPRIVLIYLLIGVVWILLADRITVALAPDEPPEGQAHIAKETLFFLVTALPLYLLIRRGNRDFQREQAARRQSDARFRAMVETEPECVKVLKPDGVLMDINRAGLAMMEADSLDQIRGRDALRLVTGEHREAYRQMLGRVAAGAREEIEYEIVGLKGSRRLLQSHAVPMRAPDGSVEGVLALTRDITERRRAEEEARTSAAMIGMVTDALPVYLSSVGADERYLWVNRRYEEWFGRPREQIVGRRLDEIHPPDAYAKIRPNMRRALAGERLQYTNRLIGADGRESVFDTLYLPHHGPRGEVQAVFVLSSDVTEREQSESALRASEARYRAVVEDQTELICRFRPEGELTFVNDAYARYFGRTVESLVGSSLFDLILDPAERERLRSLTATITPESPVMSFETRWRMADGVERIRHWIDHGLFNDRGELVEVQAVGRDVTAGKRAEDALRQSEDRYRAFVQNSSEGIWRFELNPPVPTDWPVDRQVEACFERGVLAECNDAMARMYGAESAAAMVGANLRDLLLPTDPANVKMLRDFVRSGHRITARESQQPNLRGGSRFFLNYFVGQVERGCLVRVWGTQRDITDTIQAEGALRESEARFRAIFELAAVGVARVAVDGRFLQVNRSLADLLGYTPEQLIGRDFQSLTHPDDLGQNLQMLQEALEGRADSYVMEKRYLRADGGVVWATLRAAVVRDPDGRIAYLIGVVADTSEQKLAEEALRQSEATTRALLDAVPDLMFRMNREGRYLDYHAPDLSDLALPPEQFANRLARDVLPPDRAEQCEHALEAVFRTGEPQVYEYRTEHPRTRAPRYWEVRVVRCGEDEALLLVRNITQRKQAEIELKHSQQRLALLVEQAPLGVIVWDADRRIAEWNRGAERIFGYSPAEAVGRDDTLIVPPGAAPHVTGIWSDLHSQRDGARSTSANITLDGRTVLCEWYNSPLIDHEGRDIGAASIVQDVTAREAAAAALRQSEARYRLLFDSNMDAILLTDDRGVVLEANNAAAQTLRRERSSLLERPFADVVALGRGPAWLQGRLAALAKPGGGGGVDGEAEVAWPDGRRRLLEFTARRVAPGQNLFIFRDVTERKQTERRQATMMAELDHRVKNNLSAVLALAEQSVRGAASVQAFSDSFIGRIRAMARMHSALSSGRWDGAPLRQLIRQSLEAYMIRPDTVGAPVAPHGGEPGGTDRIGLHGPEVIVPARAVSPLAMALHELATNAAKYGALSVAGGRVDVGWTVEPDADGQRILSLRWTESGGPPVPVPVGRGFGTDLIRGGIAYELSGTVSLDFRPSGACCQIRMPLDLGVAPAENRADEPILPHAPATNGLSGT